MDPMTAAITAPLIEPARHLIEVADRLGAIEAVKRKLVKQPDPAAAQLVTVLEELSKIYSAMESELATYLAFFFDSSDAQQLARDRAALARLESGAIQARMSEARARCGKIWNIYNRYLTPWFDRVLDGAERKQLFGLFRELSEIDSQMVDALNSLATWLAAKAKLTTDLVEVGDLTKANAYVLAAIREVRPLRKRVTDAMVQIRELEGEFIEISGAI